jgi:flagellar biosynthetic protein FliQ
MGPDQVTELMRMLLKEALIISAPVLLLATVISVIVSLTLTLISLQDQTLSQVRHGLFGGLPPTPSIY